MAAKKWKAVEILFHGHLSVGGVCYNELVFHTKVSDQLNFYDVGPGEFKLMRPELVREDLYKAICYIFTDQDVKISWVAEEPL